MTKSGEPLAFLHAIIAEIDGEGCRDWPYSRFSSGYGYVRVDGQKHMVTHVVLEFSARPQPPAPGDHALHSCDRPVCVAPWHLRWGSPLENRADNILRCRSLLGETHPLAKLTSDIVRALRTGTMTDKDAMKLCGCTRKAATYARLGKTWIHIN